MSLVYVRAGKNAVEICAVFENDDTKPRISAVTPERAIILAEDLLREARFIQQGKPEE